MAQVTGVSRPSIGVTILALVGLLVVGFLLANVVVGFVLGVIRLLLVLVALYLMARVGLFLLRKGGAKQAA